MAFIDPELNGPEERSPLADPIAPGQADPGNVPTVGLPPKRLCACGELTEGRYGRCENCGVTIAAPRLTHLLREEADDAEDRV